LATKKEDHHEANKTSSYETGLEHPRQALRSIGHRTGGRLGMKKKKKKKKKQMAEDTTYMSNDTL